MNRTVVILGASGDLTRRLLMPALYRLFVLGHLEKLSLVGYAVEDWSREQFVAHLEDGLQQFARDFDSATWQCLAKQISYCSGDLSAEKLGALKETLAPSAVFYLALPPSLFGPAAQGLGQAGLNQEIGGYRRLVVEKPFGYDLASAQDLRQRIHSYWQEEQVYRIDHFLGKETTQNLLVFRFANRFMEPLWNAQHIAQIQITFAETLGLEGRWHYYDGAGALRDMLQNHLMQLFTLTALEPPSSLDADILREHKVEVLRSVRPIPAEQVDQFAVRGQYTAGRVNEQPVSGYLQEQNIPPSSHTETFAALKFYLDNWRWKGVPFYLRSGKRMTADYAEVAVQFREVPAHLFDGEQYLCNWLIFRMKPGQSLDLMAWAKRPGLELQTHPVILTAPYDHLGEPEYSAYEQLLLDVLAGDRAHFLRYDEVEWAWQILQPVLDDWRSGQPEAYQAGSEGPVGQARLMETGQTWRPLGRDVQ